MAALRKLAWFNFPQAKVYFLNVHPSHYECDGNSKLVSEQTDLLV